MTCLDVYRLFTEPAGRIDAGSKRAIRAHITACRGCAAYSAQMSRLEESVRGWRDLPAVDSLRDRVRHAVVRAPTAHINGARWAVVKPGRTWAGMAAAAAVIAAVAVRLFVPAGPSARAVAQEMASAIGQIRNVHYVVWALEYKTGNGANTIDHKFQTLQVVEQEWYQNHSWRKEGVWGSRLIVAYPDYPNRHADGSIGTYYRYDSDLHRVVSMGESGQQISDFSLRGLLGPLYDSDPVIEFMAHQTANGHATTVLALTGAGDYRGQRCLCYIADDTNLPERIDLQTESQPAGAWTTVARDTLEYDQDLPASLFSPSTLKDEGWSLKESEQQAVGRASK